MMLTDLAQACRASGLQVEEVPGWRTRGHGEMTSVDTIVCHHTAGPASGDMPSLGVIRDGRPGLPGPLSQLGLSRSGTVYVVAAGVCWHAGEVTQREYDNWHAIGIEAEATGTGSWHPAQYAAYVRLCRALCDHYGVPAHQVLGHKEVCAPPGRKIDPNFDMHQFRQHVQEDAMPTADEIVNALMNRNLTAKDGELTVAKALRQASDARDVLSALNDLPEQIEADLPTTASLTRADVRQACTTAVRRVLGSLDEETD
jgi:hypothetical protein